MLNIISITMIITLCSGKSVNAYPKDTLENIISRTFSIGTNFSGIIFNTDVIVSLDFDFILKNKKDLKGKLVITRDWDILKDLDLDLIFIPNEINFRLSGMVACKLADNLAREYNDFNLVLGMDHNAGHFYDEESDCSTVVDKSDYKKLDLEKSFNIGITSQIDFIPRINIFDLSFFDIDKKDIIKKIRGRDEKVYSSLFK